MLLHQLLVDLPQPLQRKLLRLLLSGTLLLLCQFHTQRHLLFQALGLLLGLALRLLLLFDLLGHHLLHLPLLLLLLLLPPQLVLHLPPLQRLLLPLRLLLVGGGQVLQRLVHAVRHRVLPGLTVGDPLQIHLPVSLLLLQFGLVFLQQNDVHLLSLLLLKVMGLLHPSVEGDEIVDLLLHLLPLVEPLLLLLSDLLLQPLHLLFVVPLLLRQLLLLPQQSALPLVHEILPHVVRVLLPPSSRVLRLLLPEGPLMRLLGRQHLQPLLLQLPLFLSARHLRVQKLLLLRLHLLLA
mmetsp:Transcript_70900/g.118567  ORF Transcript_70900/g.118567 Transcript_70900/m.118567 type:complete len:293 (+) Transcript_70900:1030-1908(+)